MSSSPSFQKPQILIKTSFTLNPKMTLNSFIPILILLLLPTSYSIEDPIAKTNEDPQNHDNVLSLLDRHEAQLNRLETLIESLSKSVALLEKSSAISTTQSQPSISSPHSLPQTSLKPFFSTQFTLSSFVRLDSDPTCAAPLPYLDAFGSATYFAAGGPRGNVYVISNRGEISLEIPAVSDSPVTSILSYPIKKNASLVYTGHKDGSVAAHRVIRSDGGDGGMRLVLVESRPFVRGSRDLDSSSVVVLELHMIRRVRYIVAAEGRGRIRVFTEMGGTLYGTAIASGKVLAFMKQRLLFLTESGAGSLDLRSMVVKETECEGLNGSLAQTYVFDGSEKSKAYGFTAVGDLIHIVLSGEASNLKCRVRSIRKSEIDAEHVSIQAIRGYLIASTFDKFYVYNISSQYYGRVGPPRPLFVSTLQEIKSTLFNPDDITNAPTLLNSNPLIATDREKLVVLSLGGGYIAIYKSILPTYKSVISNVFWTVPLLLFLLFLIGMWQFYVKKKDSLVWTPEESFNTPSVFGDVTRTSDVRDARGGLRGPPRRYVSPSRYPTESEIPLRSAITTVAASDTAFRGGSELKYRGSTLETPPGFAPRREQLFLNPPIAGEHDD